MIKVLIGDIFESGADALVNTVNCEGVMGKGIALDFKKRFPDMYKEYLLACKSGDIRPGVLTIHKNLFENDTVINFPTKKHWRSTTLVKDIEDGLNYFLDHYKSWGIKSVAFPPLGCGNGGLSWDVVGPLMFSKLKNIDIDVTIFAPFGTSQEKLTVEFLESNFNKSHVKKGSKLRGAVTDNEVLILETLYRLQNRQYARPVGRIMYQKVCYILTETGAPTHLYFRENSYGPYSDGAKKSQTILANNNLMTEEKVGSMFRTKVTEKYSQLREEKKDLIAKNENYIAKTVDLVSRIKDTDQGEEIATVMYAAKALQSRLKEDPKDLDVINYIFDWKKSWKVNEEKKQSLASTVEGLTIMGWINVKLTHSC